MPPHLTNAKRRPHIKMHFQCCNIYSRIYLNHTNTKYTGNCPKCARPVQVRARPGASQSAFWTCG